MGTPALPSQDLQKDQAEVRAVNKKYSKQNYVLAKEPRYTVTGNGVLLNDLIAKDMILSPDSKIGLNDFFGLYAKEGDINYRLIDTQNGIKNITSQIGNCALQKPFKKNLEKLSIKNDSKSIRLLKKAIQDDTLDVKGDSLYIDGQGWQIKPDRYLFIAKSQDIVTPDSVFKSNGVPILTNIGFAPEQKYELPRIIVLGDIYFGEKPKESEETSEDSCKGTPLEISAGIFAGKNEFFGQEIGLRHSDYPFGVTVNHAVRGDKNLVDLEIPRNSGRTTKLSSNNFGYNSYGAGLEIHPNNYLSFGISTNFWNYTNRIGEKLLTHEDSILSQNTDSKSVGEISTRFSTEFKLPLSKKLNVGVSGVYDDRMGLALKARASWNFPGKNGDRE